MERLEAILPLQPLLFLELELESSDSMFSTVITNEILPLTTTSLSPSLNRSLLITRV